MSDDIRTAESRPSRTPWNRGKLTGPKPPLKVPEIWAIRIRLQLAERRRDLALFNLAIDSKLRGCDLVALRVRDVAHGGTVAHRAIVLQHKTQQPVQFELTDQTRESVATWITHAKLRSEGFLFPSRVRRGDHFPCKTPSARHPCNEIVPVGQRQGDWQFAGHGCWATFFELARVDGRNGEN
jgi:integrase